MEFSKNFNVCSPLLRLQENALRNLGNIALKKKSCLSPRKEDEFFSFSRVHEILAIFMSAAAFLNTFSAEGKSISRLERH